MQALRLNIKSPPHPGLLSNPAHHHPLLLPLTPTLVGKSIRVGECWTMELTSECMTAKELLVPLVLKEIPAWQPHKLILVQHNQAPVPTREVLPTEAPMGAQNHLRVALGSLRCLVPPMGAEAMRCRWELMQAAA